MADNTTANVGTAGNVFADDDIGGIHYPRVKLIKGDDGTNSGDISDANPLPIVSPTIVSTGTVINSTNGTLNATFVLASSVDVKFVILELAQTTTITAGAINFELTYDDINWVTHTYVLDPLQWAIQGLPYTLQASTNKYYQIPMLGARQVRMKMTTALAGSGTVTPYITLIQYDALNYGTSLGPGNATGNNTLRVILANDNPIIPVKPQGATNILSGQVTISTSAAIVAARTTRRRVFIRNHDNTVSGYVGSGTVSAAAGMRIDPGESIVINTNAAVNGFAASSIVFSYIEEYD